MVNGGFPPIKLVEKDIPSDNKSKERFFSNVTKKTLDIRQLLSENTQRKSVIDINIKKEDELEIVEKLWLRKT